MFEENGVRVDAFNDPVLALENYKVNYYDLVVLDIKMPRIDGFQLYDKLRQKDPKVKICFLTASEMYYEEFRDKHSDWGKIIDQEHFIQKPIKNKDLIKRIKSLIK